MDFYDLPCSKFLFVPPPRLNRSGFILPAPADSYCPGAQDGSPDGRLLFRPLREISASVAQQASRRRYQERGHVGGSGGGSAGHFFCLPGGSLLRHGLPTNVGISGTGLDGGGIPMPREMRGDGYFHQA